MPYHRSSLNSIVMIFSGGLFLELYYYYTILVIAIPVSFSSLPMSSLLGSGILMNLCCRDGADSSKHFLVNRFWGEDLYFKSITLLDSSPMQSILMQTDILVILYAFSQNHLLVPFQFQPLELQLLIMNILKRAKPIAYFSKKTHTISESLRHEYPSPSPY